MQMFRSKILENEYIDLYDNYKEKFPVKVDDMYIETKYGSTHVMHCGNPSGKPLVLLHCMGATSLCWSANIKELAMKYNVYLIDMIGEPNQTVNYTNRITFEGYMEWLNTIIYKLELKKIFLAGWSFGGYIAMGYTIYYPQIVEKVMALSPAGTVSKLTNKFMIKLFPALISGKESKIHDFWKWISNDESETPEYKIFCKGMQSFKGWAKGTKIRVYNDDEFSAIHIPCMILLGDKDPIYTKRVQKDTERINKLNEYVHIEYIDGTHGFLLQNAEGTNQKMLDFFK